VSVDRFEIDEDIARARTLPAAVYRDPRFLDLARERVFAPSWQLVPEADRLSSEINVVPFTLLPGLLDEPLLFARGANGESCLSNVCTHRGNLVALEAGKANGFRCGYHGRCFGLDGRFASMPEFEGVKDFPGPSDDLRRVEHGALGPLRFVSLAPALSLDALLRPLRERAGWLPFERCVVDPTRSRDYTVRASWALYVDNYLEGFHVPFVHRALARTLDYASYTTEVFDWSNLQVGVAADGEEAFAPPAGSPDHGRRIAGYYFWLFPNTMLNLYPWGISVNLVQPKGPDLTVVRYLAYVWDRSKLGKGAGGSLDQVELEDEAVVEAVQKGVRSRLYERGRYSAKREACVHHFHRLLARAFFD
jgi:choline monooxygenase